MTRAFTAEQRAAIADRGGSGLLAANAGSGKTAVMVERFVEAVVCDGVAVGAILALTFTEKAAGELRERLRRRFGELGEHEHARAAEGAAVGTIHGFCAGVLRAHPFAVGLDPRFTVLDEPAARRLHDAAWERAVETWAAAEGAPAVDLLAGARDDLRAIVAAAYDELRSRGVGAPRLPVPPERRAPDPAELRAAAAAATACLEAGGAGVRVQAARDAVAACVDALADGGVPLPTDLDSAALKGRANRLAEPPCVAYREALAAHRRACADHHARPVLVLADGLLERFGAEAAQAKAARAAVDFEDLQLLVRDLLAGDAALRARWAERFALIMVDEFQDTNRLQLDVLEMLERSNLFAVGDELQSIYGFRHADVTIFRDRASALGPERVRRLRANFRSRPELLEVLNGAFAPIFGPAFAPLVAGRDPTPPPGAEGRLFDPDRVDAGPRGDPPVELLVTDTAADWGAVEGLGLELPGEPPWRRAEARALARRLHEEVDRGRRPGEIAVLARAAASLRLVEQALEERGLVTYVVGGRGYWSQEQVRDGLAYLQALANPLDEAALYAVLASPFAGVGADALVLVAHAGRDGGAGGDGGTGRDRGAGAWAALRGDTGWMADLRPPDRKRLQRFAAFLLAERGRAERLPAEVLLERAIAATGYDVAVLARPGGERRLANLRKLMRLAREFERSEGRDLRAFLAYAGTQVAPLAEPREGEAAMEGEGLDAVRLMTIHRAKGLEFPVVCVADLGRQGPGGGAPPLLLGPEAAAAVGADRRSRVGLRLRALGAPQSVPALDYEALAADRAAREDEEERRLFYVAMTRARETLILSGGADLARLPEPRPGAAPLTWILRALDGLVEPLVNVPEGFQAPPRPAAAAGAGTALPVPATLRAAAPSGAPAAVPTRLSFTSLGEYGRCGYRWYLRRVLGLPEVKPPPPAAPPAARGPDLARPALDPLLRGSLVHALLEDLDFGRPRTPGAEAVAAAAAASDAELTGAETADVLRLVEAFATSPLCARVAAARVVRREAPFAFELEPGPGGLLVTGVVDVLAHEPDGSVLVVDYKTNPLDALEPPELTARDYEGQRLVYALAALRNGAPRVEVAHCYLERPDEPAAAAYGPADAPALAERLVGLAGGLLAGDFAVTDVPHRELCGSCPGRRALCSHPEALTLRPMPSVEAPSAADGPASPRRAR